MSNRNILSLDEAIALIKAVPAESWEHEDSELSRMVDEYSFSAQIGSLYLRTTWLGCRWGRDRGHRISGALAIKNETSRKLFSYTHHSLESLHDYVHDLYFEREENFERTLEFLSSGKFPQNIIDKVKNVKYKQKVAGK